MSYKKQLNDKFLKNELKISKSHLFFISPEKSKYNCRGIDVFSNSELLLLLCYASMEKQSLTVFLQNRFS